MRKPALIVIAGPNGAGKTSTTSKILRHEWADHCVYVNPDQIAKDTFGDWNSADAVIKAANLARTMREEQLSLRNNLAFETVFSAQDKIDFLKRAKEADFFIRLFFVGTDSPTINIARVALRVSKGRHDVPVDKIVSRYAKSVVNCATASKFVDRAYIYDNSVDNRDARLLFRTSNGRVVKTYGEINEWAQIVAEALS